MKYKELISKMTLEEKASLLSGKGNFTTKSVQRLGIPSMFLADGPHGVRKQMGAADHLGLNASLPATCYPTAAAMANAWDVALSEELGTYLGSECVALRVNMLLGPGLNMKRAPLCGRAFEYFSEDPCLAGKLAAAYIRGIQSKGVSACPKHFAVNSQEQLRMSSDSVLDARTLREIYLTGFEIAVKEGHPQAIMSSYNQINGTYANENKSLLRDILVDEWGFDGIVISDWGGSNDHVNGVAAGSHLEMPAPGAYSDCALVDAVREGHLPMAVLDERVDEYLNILYATIIPADAPTQFDAASHHAFARRAAAESVVLLRNEGNILPLHAQQQVAVIGDFATTPRYQGAGSSIVNPTQVDSALDMLKASGLSIAGWAQGYRRDREMDDALLQEAVALAKDAEIVLLYLGLAEVGESEGMDRLHMDLAQNQTNLVHAVLAVNPNVVVVLSCGCVVALPWADKVRAIVHGYLSGQAGAGAMADVLCGKVNPSGKLAETYPLTYSDTPAYAYFPGKEKTAEYREGLFIGYRYYNSANIPVRFPFGFGLSYTSFVYSDLSVAQSGVSFTLTNEGSVAGGEIAQLYIGKQNSALFRPAKELKGFTKVFLQPKQSMRVTIPFDFTAFRSFNSSSDRWEIEGGAYEVYLAASLEDVRLAGSIRVDGGLSALPYDPATLPSYYAGTIQAVGDEEFTALLGRPIPPSLWDRGQLLTRNDTISQLCYAKSPFARFIHRRIYALKIKAEKEGKPELNILSIYNLPFRGLAKLMGSRVNMEMVDAMLNVVNGQFFAGTARLLGAWRRKGRQERATARTLGEAGKAES